MTLYGIPIWAIVVAAIVVIASIVFAVYVLRVRKRLGIFGEDFAKAIDEFNDKCNPGHPMTDTEWEEYASVHTQDFENASKAVGSKFIATFVKDLANAHALVDINENHKAYMDDAKDKNNHINLVNEHLPSAIQAQHDLFDGAHYLAKSEAESFEQTQKTAIDAVEFCMGNGLKDYLPQPDEASIFNQFVKKLEQNRTDHNVAFVKAELERCSGFFDNVLAYPLDPQQRDAIVNGEDNCLVVSSAGSGKTSTIQGKVRYLIDMCQVDPDDILLITYTRKAAEELRSRIGYEGLTSSTFHGLAYRIISQVDKAPTIATEDFALNLFYEQIKEPKFVEAVTYYLVNLLSRVKDPEKYENEHEYLADRRKYGIQAYFPDMDGRIIFTRSEQERKICHFLSTHSVDFRYEERYQFDTATSSFKQYKPDFTIYYSVDGMHRKLYLEHFAVGKNGMVPKWFGQGQGKTWQLANTEYNQGIAWKRQLHKKNNTVLIETTSAMFTDGTWQQQLTDQLTRHGVKLVEKPAEEVYKELVQRDKHKEKTVLELIMSFINLLKSNCKSIDEVIAKAQRVNDGRDLFIMDKMIKPFYLAYQDALKQRGEIDFTDAILQATEYCNSNKFDTKYKYIIVDEFQDISFDRYKFMMSLRSQKPLGKIFAVGDDWQSIYRFSGSDMALFNNFSQHFGFTSMCKIESTYRFAQPTIGISSAFIQKNQSQVRKNVKSPKKDAVTTITFQGYSEDRDLAIAVADRIKLIPPDKSVYILSRYSFDFNIFKGGGYGYHENDRTIEINIEGRKVRCLTVHQAKGLEADHVILLKCDSDIYGFPSLISDDPVLEYLLSQQEEGVEFAEERRVFYVAITRAKLSTTIFYRMNNPSVFVDELYDSIQDDGSKRCPRCGYGHLNIRKEGITSKGDYFVMIGCTNALAGCDFVHTQYYKVKPPQAVIDRLIRNEDPSISNKNKRVGFKTS